MKQTGARAKPLSARIHMHPTTVGTIKSPGSIKIIGGQWKRSILPVPAIEGLRPTPNRIRETLFNWLGQDLTGLHCVDAFAGTGALGFEAASRGAALVLMCERDPQLARALIASRDRLGAQSILIQRGDAIAMLASLPAASQDVIFLDPPFAQPTLFVPALQAAMRALKTDGVLYLESNQTWQPLQLQSHGLSVIRCSQAGQVHFYLLGLATANNTAINAQ
jgi:16S rRNA (guanine966-N2)-methyltransferase